MTQSSASQSRLVNGIRRVREFIVSELIGRSVRPQPQVKTQPTTDAKRPDYAWYDKLRLGLQPGYELATPFCRPIISNIVAWTLGDLFTITAEEDQLQSDANKFVQDHKSLIIGWMQDALALGDGYLFLNPLGSLTRLTPDVVEIGTDPSDADRIVKMTITTVSVDDETTTDVWTLEGREITISGGERTAPEVQTYSNPLGLIPVVHLAWNRQANEIYGRPVYEQLVTVFSRYHDLLHSTLRGVEIMGMPMPVISGVENLERAIEANKTSDTTVRTEDGGAVTRPEVDWEQFRGQMLWLEGKADFNFRAPAPFASDSRTMLKLLFLLIVESVNIPEFVFGTAIASSKASAEAQMPAFTRVIQQWRIVLEQYLIQLMEVWLAVTAMSNAQAASTAIVTTATPSDEQQQDEQEERLFNVEWQPLSDDAEVTLQKLAHADRIGALSREEQLRILDLVDDPAQSVLDAEAEAATRQDRFDLSVANDLNEDSPQPDDEDEDDEE